jgi:predicted aspartyl protease
MTHKLLIIIQFTLFFFFAVLFCVEDIHAFNLDIKNDKITLHADNVPLNEILKKIADKGIAIYIDPEINPRVSASLENIDIEKGLKSILKSLNHIFVWESVADPLKNASSKRLKLAEIQIFRRGKKDLMIPLKIEQSAIGSFREPEPKAISKRETKITIRGNLIFVPVILGYQGREIETTLILDTGSNSIVLHENIANSLEIGTYSHSKAKGVGGIEIETKVTKLDYVKVGPHKKINLTAHIIEYEDPNIKQFNGLLGMNFLKNLKYSIDFDRQVLSWQP